MFEEKARKRREAGLSSGFLFHKDEKKKEDSTKGMTGLLQKENGEGGPQVFSERLHKENAYGHIAFGADKKGGLGVVISGKQEYHDRLAKENEKNLDLNRAKWQNKNIQGEIKTNLYGQRESAVALFSGKDATQEQMVLKLKEYERTNGNDQMEKQLPFLTLEKDREEKVRLSARWQEAKELGLKEEAKRLELEGQRLSFVISQKEQQEQQFRLELSDQLKKLREHPKREEKGKEPEFWRSWKQPYGEGEDQKDGMEDGTEAMDDGKEEEEKDDGSEME